MDKQPSSDKRGKEPFHPERRAARKPRIFKRAALRWAFLVTGWSFIISFSLSFLSGTSMSSMGTISALLLLLAFIFLGILFDILGLATATASEKPFHSMAARRVKGAHQSLKLIARAEHVSSFCNDVVGDITGIISGTTCIVIATSLARDYSLSGVLIQMLLSALVASLTVGGKALGKSLALSRSTEIVFLMGRFLALFSRKKR